DMKFEAEGGVHEHCHQTTYGMSERLVGAVVGCHGDDNGLILPPEIAPTQVVIVPVLFKDSGERVLAACRDIQQRLQAAGLRVHLDEREKSPGEKYYHWELRGVPLRLEVGPKDVEKGSAFSARRDAPGKEGKKAIPLAQLEADVKALLADIQASLHRRHEEFTRSRVRHVQSLDEARRVDGSESVGFILLMAVCSDGCAAAVEKGLDIKTLGVPVDEQHPAAPCAVCRKQAQVHLRFARTY
ncbi:MAG TPA: His/Gly/Thr/Pro-type tRNA ligase C-terminal domain-containing protein, partial [Candidatus Thermoplasmatota archaeon]|nr:His/Gly/Thr/Pro-type tRNA ligase C-terminal domain-containing protein [Candidatus Thermoplasmatota archaeon]